MENKNSTSTARAVPSPTGIRLTAAQMVDAGAPPKTRIMVDPGPDAADSLATAPISGNGAPPKTRIMVDPGPGTADSLAPAATPVNGAPMPGGGLTMVLQASRAELEGLLTETQNLQERSWRAIRTLLDDSQRRASQAVDACLVGLEQEIRARVSGEMENLEVEADARLAARLDQALSAARQQQHQMEQELAATVAENRKQSEQILTDAVKELRQCAQTLLGDFQGEAQRQLGELAKTASLLSTNIRHLSDSLGTELKQRVEEALQLFQSRPEQVWQELAVRTEQRIAETARTCTTELAKQAQQAVDQEMSAFLSQALRRFNRSSDAPPSNSNT